MSPMLSWYKVVMVPTDAKSQAEPGRVLLLGGGSVKSGSQVEFHGVHYSQSPEVQRFEMYRRHFRHHDRYTKVDTVPASFGQIPGYGYGARSPAARLRSRHSRAVNRTFQFRDDLGNQSADLSTARFGHLEVSTVELWGTAATAGHLPYGSAKLHVLAKPMKDPTIEFSVLGRDSRLPTGNSLPDRGYTSLDDLVYSEIADVDADDGLRSTVESILTNPPSLEIAIQPRIVEIPDGQTGECEISIELMGPGTFHFAIQAVSNPEPILMLALDAEDDPEDPLDEPLKGVMVSDILSVTLLASGDIFVQ